MAYGRPPFGGSGYYGGGPRPNAYAGGGGYGHNYQMQGGGGGYYGGGGGGTSSSSSWNRAPEAVLNRYMGKLLKGEIRSWKGDWGFLICPARFEGDVFCHRDNVQLEEPNTGMQVQFSIGNDKHGRPTAVEVQEPTITAPEDLVGEGRIEGQIRSWKKEWGFIVSPDQFEGDLFCHMDHLQVADVQGLHQREELSESMTDRSCTFTVMLDHRGRVCAAEVQVDGHEVEVQEQSARNSAADAPHSEPKGKGKGKGKGKSKTPTERAPPTEESPPPERALIKPSARPSQSAEPAPGEERFTALEGMQLEGSVRSWKRDWGFIVSPDNYEGDLFCHKDSLQNEADSLANETVVSFKVGFDTRGRAMAQEVYAISKPEDWKGSEKRIYGKVRSFRLDWGFLVAPSAFEGDIFFHIDYLSGIDQWSMAPGVEVSFVVSEDPKGRCIAKDIRPAGQAPFIPNSAGGGGMKRPYVNDMPPLHPGGSGSMHHSNNSQWNGPSNSKGGGAKGGGSYNSYPTKGGKGGGGMDYGYGYGGCGMGGGCGGGGGGGGGGYGWKGGSGKGAAIGDRGGCGGSSWSSGGPATYPYNAVKRPRHY
eukprot:CAMPEP_0206437290 /NCGR_PEP_ID=MMETSP0324_2-20121206/10960_1 /ASSEMBLY_ACC=CAM_ASM_000836 /TAXON_ID=2866 /ORGANISM="Crypthecodinium cohnii, Strain Seligo" /LENGTH=588 /DNA_ID=CAMNT_0053904557 /DNA_START=125 /DNA_END=1891 /DNA_ORIENTATION=-